MTWQEIPWLVIYLMVAVGGGGLFICFMSACGIAVINRARLLPMNPDTVTCWANKRRIAEAKRGAAEANERAWGIALKYPPAPPAPPAP